MVSSTAHAEAWTVLLMIFTNHDIAKCMMYKFYGKEMRPKAQVATRVANTYYTDFALLSISVSWLMLLDKHSLFVLV